MRERVDYNVALTFDQARAGINEALRGEDSAEFSQDIAKLADSARARIKLRAAQVSALGIFPNERIVSHDDGVMCIARKTDALYVAPFVEGGSDRHLLITPNGEMSVFLKGDRNPTWYSPANHPGLDDAQMVFYAPQAFRAFKRLAVSVWQEAAESAR